MSRVCIVSHSFTPISSGLWSLTKKYLEYSKCFLFKQAPVLVCLTDRPHIKSKTIKGVFSNTVEWLCVFQTSDFFSSCGRCYTKTIFGFQKSREPFFFRLIVQPGLEGREGQTRLVIFDGAANKLLTRHNSLNHLSSPSTRHSPHSVKARFLLSLISTHLDWGVTPSQTQPDCV